jgi:hypothetical protein
VFDPVPYCMAFKVPSPTASALKIKQMRQTHRGKQNVGGATLAVNTTFGPILLTLGLTDIVPQHVADHLGCLTIVIVSYA